MFDTAVQMNINILAVMTKNETAIEQVYNVVLNDLTNINQLYKMIY